MVIYAHTKYDPGDRIMCRFRKHRPGEISEGVIGGITVHHHQHAKEDRHMIYYVVEPSDAFGFEHDDHETIYEKEILGPAPVV